MKRIIYFCAFFVFFGLAFGASEEQDFILFNEQLQSFKSDKNASILDRERNERQILDLIAQIDANFVNDYAKQRQDLQSALKKLNKNSDEFKQNLAKLEIMALNEEFYNAFLRLKELFKQGASSEDIENSVLSSIEVLESLENASSGEKFKAQIATYTRILDYLKNNAHLFESNFFFAEFKLQDLIDKINNLIKIKHINSGKVAISIAVFVFFWLLRVFIPPLFLLLLMKIFFKNHSDKKGENKEELREIFITRNLRPFRLILFFYAFSVVFAIFYYPSPVNLTINKIFYVIYAVLVAWLILGLLNSYGLMLVSKFAQKSGRKEVANLIIKILYFVIIIIAALLILAHLGFNVSAIIASLGIGGLAVALAAKDIIANFFASLIISFDDSINQGDWVEVGGVEGNVVETGLRKTTIRTFDNSLVFLPNSTVMSANIKNWSKRKIGRHVRMNLGVAYDAKPEQLEKCVADLRVYLAQSPLVAHEKDSALNRHYSAKYRQNLVSVNDLEGYKNACYVNLNEFADSSINIELYFYIKAIATKDFREAKQALMLDFMRILEQNGLGFAFPSLSIYVENLKDLAQKKADKI